MLTITILVSVYNKAETVQKCIDSLLAVKYLNKKILVVDGYSSFNYIYDNMRSLYVDEESDNIEVFGVVFIKKQMEMHAGGRTYTGLGGSGQTVIWKAWDRYYRPDEVTP